MNGYKKRMGDKEVIIAVATMPYRKKLCLVVQRGSVIAKYATFNNDEAAYAFMDIFADFIGAERIEWFGRNNNDTERSDRDFTKSITSRL